LATIYERYGSRLLEQNVRSFLQFTGKINNGIRKTIKEEPHMFLAFNNGIAATAEEVTLDKSADGKGLQISKVRDFQIVNGGQTTASIYHTLKKDKSDISGIFVQVKLSVVKQKKNFSLIVSRIAEYANTQNKVSVSDLSSNKPYHIDLEKISRAVFAPHVIGQTNQTKWFYERARGQYKNARIKEGFTKAKQKAFDLKNPKNQMFNKEDLAKYLNAYEEIYDGKKLAIGPHTVVRGNQKNYVQFINYNVIKKVDNIYFEDVIAKAILFRAAEKVYGIKPNSIGDMRYITVPYTICLISTNTNNKIDLYKIWKNQAVSDQLKDFLYKLMVKVEDFIKKKAPGALYGEWAKKEECWNEIKRHDFKIDFKTQLKQDFEDPKNPSQRKRITDEETAQVRIQEELETLKSVPPKIWHIIEEWGRKTDLLTPQQKDVAFNMAGRIKHNSKISDYERNTGVLILALVVEKAPALLTDVDDLADSLKNTVNNKFQITLDLVKKIVAWDKKNKKLMDFQYLFMADLATGKKPMNKRNIELASKNLETLKKKGFS